MNEWLEVHSESTQGWLQLAGEALEFVGGSDVTGVLVRERSAAAAKRTLEFFTADIRTGTEARRPVGEPAHRLPRLADHTS